MCSLLVFPAPPSQGGSAKHFLVRKYRQISTDRFLYDCIGGWNYGPQYNVRTMLQVKFPNRPHRRTSHLVSCQQARKQFQYLPPSELLALKFWMNFTGFGKNPIPDRRQDMGKLPANKMQGLKNIFSFSPHRHPTPNKYNCESNKGIKATKQVFLSLCVSYRDKCTTSNFLQCFFYQFHMVVSPFCVPKGQLY